MANQRVVLSFESPPMDPLLRNNVREYGQGSRGMVFAHGFGTDQNAWRFVAPTYAVDHRVVLFDHVGFGGSDLRAYSDTRHASLDGYASDLIELLDALGLDEIVYVGHSAGAAIGILAALREPGRFARIALLGCSPHFLNDPPDYLGGFERHEIDALLDQLDADQMRFASIVAPMAIGEQGARELVEHFGDGLRALDPLVARRFGRLAFLIDIRSRVAALQVPALVVQCSHDSIVPRSVGLWLHAQLAGSRYEELDASGHCPHLTHPDATRAALDVWLNGEA